MSLEEIAWENMDLIDLQWDRDSWEVPYFFLQKK
jgi:hypothetical protein